MVFMVDVSEEDMGRLALTAEYRAHTSTEPGERAAWCRIWEALGRALNES